MQSTMRIFALVLVMAVSAHAPLTAVATEAILSTLQTQEDAELLHEMQQCRSEWQAYRRKQQNKETKRIEAQNRQPHKLQNHYLNQVVYANGHTRLTHAAYSNQLEPIEAAIYNNIDLDVPGRRGRTPLTTAMDWRNFGIALPLIEAGADIHIAGVYGDTPAYLAIFWQPKNERSQRLRLVVFEKLLSRGATVNEVVKDQHPHNAYGTLGLEMPIWEWALYRALPEKFAHCLRYAWELDVDKLDSELLNKRAQDGRSYRALVKEALMLTQEYEHGDPSPVLITAKEDIPQTVQQYRQSRQEYLSKARKARVEMDERKVARVKQHYLNQIENEKEHSHLTRAADNGDLAVIESAIDNNVDLDMPGKWQRTPLATAIDWGHFAIAEVLIEAGADVNKADRVGYTPAYLAIFWQAKHEVQQLGQLKVLRMLLANGAKVTKIVQDQNTFNHYGTLNNALPIWEWALYSGSEEKFAYCMKYAWDFDNIKLDAGILARKANDGRSYEEIIKAALDLAAKI